MVEHFVIQIVGYVVMGLFVIAFFGTSVVQLVLGRPASLAYLDSTSRVVIEFLGAAMIIGVAWQAAKHLIPEEYLPMTVWSVATAAVVSWVFVAVRNSQVFKGFLNVPKREEGDAAPAAQDRDPQP